MKIRITKIRIPGIKIWETKTKIRTDIRRNGNPGGQNDYGQNYGNANPVNLAGRGQPYFTGSAPNSSQPQGGGRYQGTPDQRHHQPPKQKKPVSKLAIFVAIEAIAAVALFAGAYKITSDRFFTGKSCDGLLGSQSRS